VLALIMMPLATTEIGIDGWIEEIMKNVAEENKFDSGLVLVYTSAIMMVLRFFAGPIIHKLSPIGLLIISAALALVGIYWLSFATGMIIFAAATVYAFGKTFFWPTMLGVAGEQTPRGGALTLNALGGIGMLAVGTLGTTYIGTVTDSLKAQGVAASAEVSEKAPELFNEAGELAVVEPRREYGVIAYEAISDDKVADALEGRSDEEVADINETITAIGDSKKQGALAQLCIFPAIMLLSYIGLGLYFKSRGGYTAEVLTGHAAEDAKFTGGVEGPADR